MSGYIINFILLVQMYLFVWRPSSDMYSLVGSKMEFEFLLVEVCMGLGLVALIMFGSRPGSSDSSKEVVR
jgi:hypothetical protein